METMFKKIKKHIHKKIHKHICKHKSVHHFLHHTHDLHHHLIHAGEIAIVVGVSLMSFMSADYKTSGTQDFITDHSIIATNLIEAQKRGGPVGYNIISKRKMDGSVENTFYPGYCTYGAARISPEFFPYTDSKTQERTRGGNAIDRCNNAQEAGFKTSTTPAIGTLAIYGNSPYGHVGKVMYTNLSRKTMIIRDMNRIGKYVMTDRREETNNKDIKCYIYPKSPVTNTSTIVSNTETKPEITTKPTIITTKPDGPITEDLNTETKPTVITTKPDGPITEDLNTETKPTVITTKPGGPITEDLNTKPATKIETIKTEDIELNFDEVSYLGKHFISQREIKATIQKKNITKIGDKSKITITITNKKTKKPYNGFLQVPFDIITSNNKISSNYSTIKFVKNGKIDITLKSQQTGKSYLLFNFGGERIGTNSIIVE